MYICSGVHPASYLMNTGDFLSGSKVTGV